MLTDNLCVIIIIILMISTISYVYADGSPGYLSSSSNDGCTVWVNHEYSWTPTTPPRNNAPHERSLYPGDVVYGVFSYGSDGCCGVKIEGPSSSSSVWSEIRNIRYGANTIQYTQAYRIIPDMPSPDSDIINGHIHTAEYDTLGRSRTHTQGTQEGSGMTGGASFTVRGNTDCPRPSVVVTSHADFMYRNPFWETSIHEHQIVTPEGYPASNLDYTQYKHDAIPLEVGSNLMFGGYRWETIRITNDIQADTIDTIDTIDIISTQQCNDKTCSIDVPSVPSDVTYVGHDMWRGPAVNPPWSGPNPGVDGMLDDGEAVYVVSADTSGPIRITSTMTNQGVRVATGYNTTYQFVSQYEPVWSLAAVSNTAYGGDTHHERPVSVLIQYNGTISDTLHYCSVGIIYDTNGDIIPAGQTGAADAWGRLAGATCPDDIDDTTTQECEGTRCYIVHPKSPHTTGWGRWSALNPEARLYLSGLSGTHTICDTHNCTTHDTPYKNWDYVSGTDRDFVPACTMQQIADAGKPYVNVPKPDLWGVTHDWGFGTTHTIGEGATPYSYRGLFGTGKPPTHYALDTPQCEASLPERDCTIRGASCDVTNDRRCESVLEPYIYPDDYIMHGHQTIQDMVVSWCGDTPDTSCVSEAYRTIDDVMVSMCRIHGVNYTTSDTPIIDTGIMYDTRFTPYTCHNAYAVGLYAPGINGTAIQDWRYCGVEGTCKPVSGVISLVLPVWDGTVHSVYVPYTPTTGAFAGVVERPGNIIQGGGATYCTCIDDNNNNICDQAESDGQDLDGNGIIDDWDVLTIDGDVRCLDRTGTVAAAISACYAKYGSQAGYEYLSDCIAQTDAIPDGPDGTCNPAVIVGHINNDGTVDTSGMRNDLIDFVSDHTRLLQIPFLGVDGIIPIPYIVNGTHMWCDTSEPWCVTSGDTIIHHNPLQVCEGPDDAVAVKRIPAPYTMPPLYRPIFDEHWPPDCLLPYDVGEWTRPTNPTSMDIVDVSPQWPTAHPSHISMGYNNTMMIHAGTGVVRFEPCDTCVVSAAGHGWWNGTIQSTLGGTTHTTQTIMDHPPYTIQQGVNVEVVAVEPCDTCKDGWQNATSTPGISFVVTAYPRMERPISDELYAHACQADGDGGTGLLNTGPGVVPDRWHGMSCRDVGGMSVTIQDYEAARYGVAAGRESGQPWTQVMGTNHISMEVFRSGVWLNTLSILEHRGACTTYTWSPHITAAHTGCPATIQTVMDCIKREDIRDCITRYTDEGICANVFVEDMIHKQWEFTAEELPTGPLHTAPYHEGMDPRVYGCDVVDMTPPIRDIPAKDMDWSRGGSFACQEVQACRQTQVSYKCMGGEIIPDITCVTPDEQFAVVDMPYSEVMSSHTPQDVHIKAVCPVTYGMASYDAPRCDGSAIYDTHTISESADDILIYVDYYGVGVVHAGRDDAASDTIHIRPPDTFGRVHHIMIHDGDTTTTHDVSCVTCTIHHAGVAHITIQNVYGGVLSVSVPAATHAVSADIKTDYITGTVWLYLPVLVAGAVFYLVIKRYRKVLDI